jgi:uncharacterized membrane protein
LPNRSARRRAAPGWAGVGRAIEQENRNVKARTSLAASAAAALFLAGLAAPALAQEGGAEAKVKCEGVNSCKGHGDCKSASNACKGQNGCGGKGFVMMTQAECDAAKAAKAREKQ